MAETRDLTAEEARNIRFLRRLVTALTATMILGVGTVAVLLALRLTATPPPPPLPDEIALPPGAQAQAITAGPDWYLVVTTTGEALVYDRETGALRQRVMLELAPR